MKQHQTWEMKTKTIFSLDFKSSQIIIFSKQTDSLPPFDTFINKKVFFSHLIRPYVIIFNSEASLQILMSVRSYICLSVCPSGLGGKRYSRPLIKIEDWYLRASLLMDVFIFVNSTATLKLQGMFANFCL